MKYSLVLLSATLAAAIPQRGVCTSSTGVNHVDAVVKVPTFTSNDERKSVSVWVGIDGAGDTDTNSLEHTGFDVFYDGQIRPWVEWWLDYPTHLEGFIIGGGDAVKLAVDASSPTHAVASLENLTTDKNLTHRGWSPSGSPLCQTTAEWIVGDYSDIAGNGIALFKFDTLSLTNSTATGKNDKFGRSAGKFINLQTDDREVHTDASFSGDTVGVKWIGPEQGN